MTKATMTKANREAAQWLGLVLAAGAAGGLASCGSGGRGSGSAFFDRTATLLAVRFLDPNDVNLEDEETAPQAAPLVQQIEFTFSGLPDPNRINSTTMPILDASNQPAPGVYTVDGTVVTFTPVLPIRAAGVLATGAPDNGGAGLDFATNYTVRLGPQTFSFVAGVDPSLRARYADALDPKGIYIPFRTVAAGDTDAFRGLPDAAPALVDVSPVSGATGISPNLFTDPDGLFPPRPVFRLVFDGPLNPDPSNLSATVIELIDLDDRPLAFPDGLPLGLDVALIENRIDRAVLELRPSGILPFGHLLALQYDAELKGLSQTGSPAGGPVVATTFTTAADPGGALRDLLVEEFDDNSREETDIDQIGAGVLTADWNRAGSKLLQAAREFDGTGVIGRFVPPAPKSGQTTTIVLDTTSQAFPLLDGSTPDAKPGTVAVNGVFEFSDVDIPAGVIIKVSGSNPLVIKATGSVKIAGTIDLGGDNGSSEYAYDSAITSIPGGPARAGGGRGGDAHPVAFFPPDQINYLTLVSPTYAATGLGMDPATGQMKQIGGTGAQSGILDRKDSNQKYQTNNELGNCDEFRQGNGNCKIAGGGGGSMLRAGDTPTHTTTGEILNGIANVHPDGTGKWLLSDDTTCLAGLGGSHPFAPDGTKSNDFFGKNGQLKRLIGGQGGGGGGTLTDSYYCGNWCKLDSNSANDNCCTNGDNLPAQGRAPSVGDSRGGAGGGGGGAVQIQALGDLTLEATALIDCTGGNGGGGEGIGCSYWGGGGGGGAGGMAILQSASTILVKQGAVITVQRGLGDNAEAGNDYYACGNPNNTIGDGGDGGHGMIQLQVPAGSTATVVNPGTDTNGSIRPLASWIDPTNTLVPVEFTPVSVAMSEWYDFGRVVSRPPSGTNPVFSFSGLDGAGYVVTDASGNVLSPSTASIECGYLGQIDPATGTYKPGELPREDFVPTNASVRVEFQGANAIVEGSKEVDPASLTAWSGSVAIANGKQFLRWRITFDLAADGSPLTTSSRQPIVERLEVGVDF